MRVSATGARPTLARALFSGALASYAANIILGTGVAAGRIDTGRMRWIHHAVYAVTVILTATAASSLLWSAPSRPAGWLILPAAVPFALIPRFSGHSREHVVLALLAAPFLVGSTVTAWKV